MIYILLSLAFPFIVSFQCNKQKTESPSCIQQKIDLIKSKPKWNPPAEVNEYIYNGKHVYLFSADCCDQYQELYDENCNYICAPYGGITGGGDMKCSDFRASAQFVKLIWKDSR